MSLNILSASNAIGWYTRSQINHKKDISFNKVTEVVSMAADSPVKEKAKIKMDEKWNREDTKIIVNRGIQVYNAVNILAYLPLIGTIIGIAKLTLLSKIVDPKLSKLEKELPSIKREDQIDKIAYQKLFLPGLNDVKSFRKGFKVRALIETASLGSLLLIPDLIAFIVRSVEAWKQNP